MPEGSPKTRARRVTLVDVARAAGVSRTTASSILGRTGGTFSRDTVERVRAASSELGYRPNVFAKWLRTGRPRLLGFLAPVDIEYAHHIIRHQFEVGIALEARANGMDLVKVLLGEDAEQELDRIEDRLESGLLDCLILQNPAANSRVIPLLQRMGARFVVLGNPCLPGVYSVDTDNIRLGASVAEHLIALGHRRLAVLAPRQEWAWGADRVTGFLRACAAAGISEGEVTVLHVPHSMPGGHAGMKELLALPDRPTAVCAADDQTAYGAITAIEEAGLSVPGDISIVGCNNDNVLGVYPDLLTTIDLGFVTLGQMAARKAIALVEGGQVSLRDYNEFRLIPRRSSAPPGRVAGP